MNKIIARTYNHTNEFRAHITYALFGMCAVLMIAYVFNMYTVISHSVALQQAETNIAKVSETIVKLDTQYIGLSNRITPELVRARGMSEGKVASYISRTPSLGVVSLSGYEL